MHFIILYSGYCLSCLSSLACAPLVCSLRSKPSKTVFFSAPASEAHINQTTKPHAT